MNGANRRFADARHPALHGSISVIARRVDRPLFQRPVVGRACCGNHRTVKRAAGTPPGRLYRGNFNRWFRCRSGTGAAQSIPWWKEPTKDQWYAFVAAWLGWTLDAFDFTVFLLIMHPIAQTFNVSMTAVTFVFTITLWMRLLGATASGWLGDRIGRKKPLMIAILGYSLCNFAAGFSPTFLFLFTARAILGLFMGAEWPAGAPWRWRPGRSARAASWAACCRARGASASCCRSRSTGCSTIRSAGAACCGSACCPPWRSSMCASSSRSPRSGSKTGESSAPSSARSGRR